MTINLSPTAEAALSAAAARDGVSPERFATKVIEREVCSRPVEPVRPLDVDDAEWKRRLAVVEQLRTIGADRDPEEQRETMEYLIRVLDDDRPADRKLFPPELKGTSW